LFELYKLNNAFGVWLIVIFLCINMKRAREGKRDPIWDSFIVVQGGIGNGATKYGTVACNACETYVRRSSATGVASVVIEGRPRTMKNHLKRCPHQGISAVLSVSSSNKSLPTPNCLQLLSSPGSSSLSTASGGHDHTHQSNSSISSKSRVLTAYFDRGLTATEKKLMKQRSLELIEDKDLCFNFFEAPSVKRWVASIRPTAVQSLPSARVMSGSCLKERASAGEDAILPTIRHNVDNLHCCLNFICDGWENMSHQHILDVILKVQGVWCAVDGVIGEGNVDKNDCHDGIATAKLIEAGFTKCDEKYGMRIGCVATDEAGQCSRAKRILSL
jgi:hypothetical protein